LHVVIPRASYGTYQSFLRQCGRQVSGQGPRPTNPTQSLDYTNSAMILIFAQEGNTEHLVQCFGGCKVLGFFSVRLTALVLVLGNLGRINAIDAN
jgi:hypothetical protein